MQKTLIENIDVGQNLGSDLQEIADITVAKALNKKYSVYAFGKSVSIVSSEKAKIKCYLIIFTKNKETLTKVLKLTSFGLESSTQNLEEATKLFTFSRLGVSLLKASVNFSIEEVASNNIHHLVSLRYKNAPGVAKKIKYSLYSNIFTDLSKRTKVGMVVSPGNKLAIYLRQSVGNYLYLTIRNRKLTDLRKEQFKLNLAWAMSSVLRIFWKPVLMFEKHNKYEESASIVFEELVHRRRHIYFVLAGSNAKYPALKEKYGKHIIHKNSFFHYITFFSASTCIGTESLPHAIDIRVANKHVLRRVKGRKVKFVFLQHGVMYMVSLSAEARKGFRYNGGLLPEDSKIVVSSMKEAEHFIVHGEYPPETLYLTGLPKFDVAYKENDADKIVIMPTWRPWEFNKIRLKPKNTGYYKMMESMYSAVPKEMLDHVVILPHPLFKGSLKKTELGKHIDDKLSYDEILRKTKLLITDYSSISYDAFYRGSNVIFWWKDKDHCMSKYEGELMLNEENAFGDVVYSVGSLKKSIRRWFVHKQDKNYKDKFKKIVEFNDGNNTKRLIQMLETDGYI